VGELVDLPARFADELFTWPARFLDALRYEVHRRTAADWVFAFAPIVLFLEIPRYYLPPILVVIARWLRWPREHHDEDRVDPERAPLVSCVVAGRNEEATIVQAIRTISDQDYPNIEILIVDDASEDRMYELARRHARRGEVRLVRNRSGRGRSGRAAATNLGVRLARGEYIASLDADTVLDRGAIRHLVAQFRDPRVGVVAGNVYVRNADRNLLTRCQALEYAVGIDLHKRWTHICGCTQQASGAIGAFRRRAVLELGGWDAELAEDTDISLRMVKAGWRIAFAPRAAAFTEAPEGVKTLARQRTRWDRGTMRTFFRKHKRLFRPSVAGWSFALEMGSEWLFHVGAALLFPVYLAWLLWTGWFLFLFVSTVCLALYLALSLFSWVAVALACERLESPWKLLPAVLATPFYKGFLRWVRIRAVLLELFHLRYTDPFLPPSAWRNAPRF
jgi:cellulose synthase/poly-beta-1,6-N-acetylglucosamine synthase-like glycosyltransferase